MHPHRLRAHWGSLDPDAFEQLLKLVEDIDDGARHIDHNGHQECLLLKCPRCL